MNEIEITSGRLNELVDPVMHIWGLEVAFYLFLGGIAAGLMVIPALRLLMHKDEQSRPSTALPLLLVSVLMSVGMFFLFLDLHYKVHVFRFYMTFQPRSPMSWGAWILLLVYPLSLMLAVVRLPHDFPTLSGRFTFLQALADKLKPFESLLSMLNIITGLGLGIYTGILLSVNIARPLWNSGLLGVLFLTSGVSTGAALLLMMVRDHSERSFLSRLDMVLIGVEVALITMLMMNLSTSSLYHARAANMLLGGPYTASFWSLVVGVGLVVPFLLEWLEMKGKRVPLAIPATLVLIGGLSLRIIMLSAGQVSTFLPY